MPSTFFGLNIAYTGIQSYMASLNTTGNNIANTETEGYTRQQAIQEAGKALRLNTTYGMAGSGVTTTAIEQIRNSYYDVKFWDNNYNLGEYNVKKYYMSQMEDYFKDETGGIVGFKQLYDEFYNALEEVQKTPSEKTVRQNFVSAAKKLTEYFNTMSINLRRMQEDANSEIRARADEINSIAEEMATLNKQINVIEMSGGTANELRDKRNLLVDRLSVIVNVETSETPIYNSNNPDMPTGANNFVVKIAGGQTLVNGNDYNTLVYTARENEQKVNQCDADGIYDMKWSNGLDFNLYGGSLGGELKALVEMRDGNNEENFRGYIESFQAVGGVADKEVTIKVTASYLKDMDKSTLPPSGTIKLNNRDVEYESWSMVDNGDGTFNYTFQLSQPALNAADQIGKNASVGKAVDYQGIPYYQEQMNEWVREFARVFNDTLLSKDAAGNIQGQNIYGGQAQILFVGKNVTDPAHPYDFQEADQLASNKNNYYQLTAGNFTISAALLEDAGLLAVTTKKGDVDLEAVDIVEKLQKIQTDKNMMSFRGGSSQEFLECILSDIALNAGHANTFQTTYQNIANAIEQQRMSVSSVDKDEETLSLARYQRAFELNSKMVQTLTEVYDRLILQTGV